MPPPMPMNRQIHVRGCQDCPLCSDTDDGPACSLDAGVDVPRDPHDTENATTALPADCPLWRCGVTIAINRSYPAEVEGKD